MAKDAEGNQVCRTASGESGVVQLSTDFYRGIAQVLEQSRGSAYRAVNTAMVHAYWKTGRRTHQDIGQMDMYVRMYDELKRGEGDNPTLGIVLCTETDKDIAHFSVLNGSDQLFAAKYLTYLPTEEELKEEIERQKEFSVEQQGLDSADGGDTE
ncbi:MAG: PDDEXK nuclease domain-containing protein [Bifidobacterium choerinum]